MNERCRTCFRCQVEWGWPFAWAARTVCLVLRGWVAGLSGSVTVAMIRSRRTRDRSSSLRIASVVCSASSRISSSCFCFISARTRRRTCSILVRRSLPVKNNGISRQVNTPPESPARKMSRSDIQLFMPPCLCIPAITRRTCNRNRANGQATYKESFSQSVLEASFAMARLPSEPANTGSLTTVTRPPPISSRAL